MNFVCISDTHNRHYEITVPDADMVIHAGDSTGRGTIGTITDFCTWYGKLPHKYKILIAGNHDFGFETRNEECRQICVDNGIIYLQDESCEIEGIKIWGSPQTPEFCDWAFNCWRTKATAELSNKYPYIGKFWDLIPDDTDILITHGPPYDIMDKCPNRVGCQVLLKAVEKIKPKFHIFGHIHEEVGNEKIGETTFINASCLNDSYYPNNKDIKVFTIGE